MRLFTVGPVQMFDEIKKIRSNEKSVPYFRTDDFSNMMLETDELLRKFAKAPQDAKTIYLTASGTGAMEAAVINCLTVNDKALIINGGTFGQRFVDICEIHGIPYDEIKLSYGEVMTREHLERMGDNNYTALLVNIDETSTGQLYDIGTISEFCKKGKMYLIVDAISSFLCDSFDMMKYGVDVMISSSQKGACVSPGLSMIVLSPRIINERIMKNMVKSLYFNFQEYLKNFQRGQTPYTPAVGICVELYTSLKMIDKIGLENHLHNIQEVALDFRNKAESLPVTIPSYPLSNAVTPIMFKKPIAYKVFEELRERYDVYVNPTGGDLHETSLRIAHIGQLSTKDNTELISKIQDVILSLE